MKATTFLVAVYICAFLGSLSVAFEPPPKHRIKIQTSLPQIVAIESAGFVCTGSIASEGLVLTAAHCIHSAILDVEINSHIYPFTVAAIGDEKDTFTDYAFLRGNTRGIAPLLFPLELEMPPILALYFSMDFRASGRQVALPCLIMGASKDGEGYALDVVSDLEFGDSGGPVIDRERHILGVVSRQTIGSLHGYFVPLPRILEAYLFLRRH